MDLLELNLMNQKLKQFILYLRFFFKEALSIAVYLNAVIIGLIICYFTGHYSIVPFIVPCVVQIIARSSIKFKQRHINALIELPTQKEDPVFIMDLAGKIVLSTGRTKQLFDENGIKNITQFIEDKGFQKVLGLASFYQTEQKLIPDEVFSGITDKWYEIKAKPANIQYIGESDSILVWFQDITLRKAYDTQLKELLQYSASLVSNLDHIVKTNTVYDHLAAFMIKDYEAIFITRTDNVGNLNGFVFKRTEENFKKSRQYTILKESQAPIFISRRVARILSDDIINHSSEEEFIKANPFDQQVIDFIDRPLRNFITYNEEDVSIIAFNYGGQITAYEKQFIEVLLNISRTMMMLVDQAKENDQQFVQKVMGLCTAAQYSDEISGNHVLRVNKLSRFIAEKLELDTMFIETIGQVAALHDIGKVAMPDLIRSPWDFNKEQRLEMQMHTIYGAKIIETIMIHAIKEDPRLIMAKNIVLHHHQTYIGKGYPLIKKNGEIIEKLPMNYLDYKNYQPLNGEEIPLESLIVGLADRYDALRSQTSYKNAMNHDQVMEILSFDDRVKISGEQWYGEKLWHVFKQNSDQFKEIYDSMNGL
jgi:response regulator RpfG family c-di-GMP phosphodiesterase